MTFVNKYYKCLGSGIRFTKFYFQDKKLKRGKLLLTWIFNNQFMSWRFQLCLKWKMTFCNLKFNLSRPGNQKIRGMFPTSCICTLYTDHTCVNLDYFLNYAHARLCRINLVRKTTNLKDCKRNFKWPSMLKMTQRYIETFIWSIL